MGVAYFRMFCVVRNVEVKVFLPSDSGGKYEKAAVPDLASSNGSNLEEEALVELSEVRKKHPIGISLQQ